MTLALSRQGVKPIAWLLGLALALFQIWFTTGFGVLDGSMMRVAYVAFITALIFLYVPGRKLPEGKQESRLAVFIDVCCAALAIATAEYFAMHHTEITNRMRYIDEVTAWDKFFGCVTILLVLEITRRTTGWALVVVSGTLLLYAFFGDMLPRAVKHTGFSFDVIVEHLFLLNEGVYGIPIGTATTTLFGFIMFGAFLERSKMSSIFMDLACLLTRNSQGGPAKVSIFASALFGTISGSASANVYGTGIFTIPLMKRVGYRPAFAGAVEAVASTGGQIMPPVMGTAAFLMADLSGAGYLNVAKAALLPAIMYYLALLVMIHFEAVKRNLGRTPAELIPEAKSVIRRLYYLLPIGVLIACLAMGRSVVFCANIATLSIVILAMFKKETRFTFKSFLDALVASSRSALMVSACCASAGIIIGVLSLTGIGYKFINLITILAGNSLFLLMVLLMLTSFVLGMGMSSIACYLLTVTMLAPAIVGSGVEPIAVHMFLFYYGALSFITPPVAIAAFVASGISGGDPSRTGVFALRMGIAGFLVPWAFVVYPVLLFVGPLRETALVFVASFAGLIAISGGVMGYLLVPLRRWERAALLAGGAGIFIPLPDAAQYSVLAAILAVMALLFLRMRHTAARGTV